MKSLNILVVEDETIIAELIRIYLEERGHTVLGNPISFEETIEHLNETIPDIILLDIRLYGHRSGIDIANYIQENSLNIPFIYLTSQYDQKNLARALSTSPTGYLTKPIQKESLWTTIEVAYTNHSSKKVERNRVRIYDGQKSHWLPIESILFIKANHVYVDIIIKNGGTITARQSLTQLAEQLNDPRFFQCHRSYIVNQEHISFLDKNKVTIDQHIIPVSRSRSALLHQRMKEDQ